MIHEVRTPASVNQRARERARTGDRLLPAVPTDRCTAFSQFDETVNAYWSLRSCSRHFPQSYPQTLCTNQVSAPGRLLIQYCGDFSLVSALDWKWRSDPWSGDRQRPGGFSPGTMHTIRAERGMSAPSQLQCAACAALSTPPAWTAPPIISTVDGGRIGSGRPTETSKSARALLSAPSQGARRFGAPTRHQRALELGTRL
jgi:hypothetical protein